MILRFVGVNVLAGKSKEFLCLGAEIKDPNADALRMMTTAAS